MTLPVIEPTPTPVSAFIFDEMFSQVDSNWFSIEFGYFALNTTSTEGLARFQASKRLINPELFH